MHILLKLVSCNLCWSLRHNKGGITKFHVYMHILYIRLTKLVYLTNCSILMYFMYSLAVPLFQAGLKLSQNHLPFLLHSSVHFQYSIRLLIPPTFPACLRLIPEEDRSFGSLFIVKVLICGTNLVITR